MLKLNKQYASFMKEFYIGRRAYFIDISKNGYDVNLDILAHTMASFSTCVVYGDEPFDYKSDMATLCKEVQKLNPYTSIIIKTDGMKRPTGLNSVKNVEYIIEGKLKKTGISYDDRVDELIWKWYGKAGAKFVFDVYDEDDYEEINLIISSLTINKTQVYVNIKGDDFQELLLTAYNNGYNIHVKFDGEWFDEE